MQARKAYSYDDVLLVPQYSEISSRGSVDLSSKIGHIKLDLPILSANMDTVTEDDMAIAMHQAGGAGILHRFAPLSGLCGQEKWLLKMKEAGAPRIISVGVSDHIPALKRTYDEVGFEGICVDVAHGDHKQVVEMLQKLGEVFDRDKITLIAGNVATPQGALTLAEAGAHVIKVGVGPGSVCTTRIQTGHGYPQLSAVAECVEAVDELGCDIIADGGIRFAGDIVKALAVGANAVMVGSMLAGTEESPGEVFTLNGESYKRYRGMASREVQEEKRSNRKARVEGVSANIPLRGSVQAILQELRHGIESGLSYSGATNLNSLFFAAEFVEVTPMTLAENHAHNTNRL